jgi:uncharacterized RDD family membrane protein YckC
MGEKVQTTNITSMNANLIIVIGAIIMILGLAIIEIPGFPFRGSGLGTILFGLGIVGLIVGLYRRRQQQTVTKTG